MDGGGPRVQLSLPAEATSVPAARHALRSWLAEVDQAHLSDDVELAVTEVVTNALVHAATRVEVGARIEGAADSATVRVEVADGSSHLPRQREASSASGTGRGLRLLDQTVTRWGAERRSDEHGGGKVVWFEIGVSGDLHAGEVGLADPDGATVPSLMSITLLDVPLLLLGAWTEHTSALLREHLLVQLDSDDVEAALERHASAGEVLALLEEQWPEPERQHDPHQLLAASVEAVATVPRMDLAFPRRALRSFAVLEEMVEEALVLADTGALLTAPTQPEMRAMRHWLVAEVLGQAEGEAPRPHVLGGDLDGPWLELAWDASSVDAAPSACLAADGENRIVAASEPALEFLGYDRSLVGQRLLRIIPPRFRQAHLAGFSLHLVNGRGPLIGVPVVVPLVCADGEERLAEMVISPEPAGRGRSVYLAHLRPL